MTIYEIENCSVFQTDFGTDFVTDLTDFNCYSSNGCNCGNEPGTQVDDSLCNKPCSGNNSVTCGGYVSSSVNYNSVYGTGL